MLKSKLDSIETALYYDNRKESKEQAEVVSEASRYLMQDILDERKYYLRMKQHINYVADCLDASTTLKAQLLRIPGVHVEDSGLFSISFSDLLYSMGMLHLIQR